MAEPANDSQAIASSSEDGASRRRRRRRALATIAGGCGLLIVIAAIEGVIVWQGLGRPLLALVAIAEICAAILVALILVRDTARQFQLLEQRESSLNSLAAGLERRVAWRTRSLTELNHRFDAALRATGVTVFTQDRGLVYTWVSKGAFGLQPPAIIGRGDDEVLPARFRAPVKHLKREVMETGETARTELSVQEGDVERWYSLTMEPQRGADERVCGITGGAVDITDRKEHESRIHLLMRELNHRSRNLLAVIQAIARQSAANSDSTAEFLERFSARLQSLAESHDLLVRDAWKGSSMQEIVRSQLGHYADLIGSQIDLQGGTMRVRPDAAQHLGMALHELATNAAKYGALSTSEGKVAIRWSVDPGEDAARRCRLSWQEAGGPPVQPPRRRGFGTVVIERTVVQALDGTVTLDYAPAGFSWLLDFPSTYLVPDSSATVTTQFAPA